MTESFRPIATPTRTVEIMRQYDIQMKKSLGQNFLVEPNMLNKMIDAGEVDKNTTVIEIGPGIGALTEYLARASKEVFAFEIDPRFVKILPETLSAYHNVTVYHQDILKVDFNSPEYAHFKQADRLVVVANLPYYITTPIIMNLIASDLTFDALVMMMQKEVAERMTAQISSKQYGSLTIAIENDMQSEIAFIVPKNVFIPKPNVDSAVLKLTRREVPLVDVDDATKFQEFVQIGFKQRRKTLWNNYKPIYGGDDASNAMLEQAFNAANIEASRRAESLSIYEFAALYKQLLH